MSLLADDGDSAFQVFQYDWLPLLSPLFFLLRLDAHCSHIRLSRAHLDVKFGWAFSARVPLARVRSAAPCSDFVGGIGVHGFGGRWLVNGSHRGIVRIEVEGGARARVLGIPLTLTTLRLGVAEPAAFVAALSAAARGSAE